VIALFPSDPLRPRLVDEHYRIEEEAAKALGLEVGLLNHDLATRGDAAGAVSGISADGSEVVYRGWMLTSLQYHAVAEALGERGLRMVTQPDKYRAGHELPGWYSAVDELSPRSIWTDDDNLDELIQRAARWPVELAILRDFTKSMKHYWHEACFVPNVHDPVGLRRVAGRFRELRDDDFTGGYVLRAFETFTSPEVRTWWIDGLCVACTAHPDTPDLHPPDDLDLTWLDAPVTRVGAPFVTVDLAKRDDGAWRIVELGDGQVSDLPRTADPTVVFAAFSNHH
jgi:hypothetical protein